MFNFIETSEKKELIDFKDPFSKEQVSQISIFNFGSGWIALIKFINGNTMGEQKFENEDFATIVSQMENFVKAL